MKRRKTTLRIATQVLILIVVLIVSSCTNESTDTSISDSEIVYESPIVSLILVDISLSTNNRISIPGNDLLGEFIDAMGSNPKNVISFGNIGSYNESDRQYTRFTNISLPKKFVSGSMSQKEKIMAHNHKVDRYNQHKKLELCQAFDSMSVRKSKATDLNTAFMRAMRFLNEPMFRNHTKYLVLISDGFNDTQATKQLDVDLKGREDVNFLLVGWQNTTDGLRNIDKSKVAVFEAFNSVPGFIKEQKTTKP